MSENEACDCARKSMRGRSFPPVITLLGLCDIDWEYRESFLTPEKKPLSVGRGVCIE